MTLLRNSVTIGSLTMISRVAGFVRDVLMAALLGAGAVADAFLIALKLPSLLRHLSAEGAFSAAFIPLFVAQQERDGLHSALKFAEQAMMMMGLILTPVIAAGIAFMPAVVGILAPGFGHARFELAVGLAQLTFPYLLLISLASLLGGVLNARGYFAPFAGAPIVFNLTLIAAMISGLCLAISGPNMAAILAAAVTAAGVIQLLFLGYACRRRSVKLSLAYPRLSPELLRLLQRMAPGIAGAAVLQANLMVGAVLASTLAEGALSYLYYAERLYQLPLGVVGVTLATALLPQLSRQFQAGDSQNFQSSLSRGVEIALMLALPITVGLVLIAEPLVRILFERGEFQSEHTHATAQALAAYALGTPAYITSQILTRSYFAQQDTTTPVKIAAGALLVNAGAGLILIQLLDHTGIALACTLAAWSNFAGLWLQLRARLDPGTHKRVLLLIVSSAAMGGICWYILPTVTPWLTAGSITAALILLAMIASLAGIYFVLSYLMGAIDPALTRR